MPSIPVSLVRYSTVLGAIEPHYFDNSDVPWISEVLEVFEHCVGMRLRDVRERVDPAALSVSHRVRAAVPIVSHLLLQHFVPRVQAAVEPTRARQRLFANARDRDPSAFARTAAELGVDEGALRAALFADLRAERRLSAPDAAIDVTALVLDCNTAIAQAVLRRAIELEIELEGHSRAVVRLAKLRGLICSVRTASSRCLLDVSGPLSLFRRTTMYGRALADLVPTVAWCRTFRLRARCRMQRALPDVLDFSLTPRSPIRPAHEPRRYDSMLEERFAREFTRATSQWRLVREPEPVPSGGRLIFPDFEARRVDAPGVRWFVEIVGFWTPDYLARKFAAYRAARLDRLILCVDEAKACAAGAPPEGAHVVSFRRSIDPTAVLRVLEGDGTTR